MFWCQDTLFSKFVPGYFWPCRHWIYSSLAKSKMHIQGYIGKSGTCDTYMCQPHVEPVFGEYNVNSSASPTCCWDMQHPKLLIIKDMGWNSNQRTPCFVLTTEPPCKNKDLPYSSLATLESQAWFEIEIALKMITLSSSGTNVWKATPLRNAQRITFSAKR